MEFDFDEIFDEKESEHATKQVIKGWTPGGGNPLWDADGVVDGVFVGSRKSAMDKDEMLRRNIGFVLICSAEFECRPRFQHLFTYKVTFSFTHFRFCSNNTTPPISTDDSHY